MQLHGLGVASWRNKSRAAATLVSSSEMRNFPNGQSAKPFQRQHTTSWISGIGPLSTILASAWWWVSLSCDDLSALCRRSDHLKTNSAGLRHIYAPATIIYLR